MKAWFWVLVATILVSACILNKKSEQSELYAITDGRLALGVVPSVSDRGMQAYRLLLCKKAISYSEQDFSDPAKCRSALIDRGGRDVVLQSDALLRPFGEKSNGALKVAAGVAGIALIGAGGLVGYHKWFSKGSHMLNKSIRNVNKISKPDIEVIDQMSKVLNDANAEKHKDLISKLEELKGTVNEGDKAKITEKIGEIGDANVAARMRSEFGGYDDATVEKMQNVVKGLEEIDPTAAKQMQRVADGESYTLSDEGLKFYENRLTGWRDNINKQLKQLEESPEAKAFNDFIKENKEALRGLNGKNANKIGEKNKKLYADFGELRKKLDDSEAMQNLHKSMGVDDIDDTEEILDRMFKPPDAIALDLHRVEATRDAVRTAILDNQAGQDMGKIVAGIEKEIAELDVPILDLVKDDKLKQFIKEFDIDEETTRFEEVIEMMKLVDTALDGNTIDVRKIVRQDEKGIITAREYVDDDLPDEDMIIIVKGLRDFALSEQKRADDLRVLRIKADAYGTAPEKFAAELESLDKEHAELTAKLMEENAKLAKEAVEKVDQKNRKWWGLGGLSAATAGAVMVSLNSSIWGNGEKQLGEHWSQIFSTNSDFADATMVRDLPGILTKLAQVLGHSVNREALALGGTSRLHDRNLGGR